jgi:hypothetical protein
VEAEERIRATPDASVATGPGPDRDRAAETGEAQGAIAHERCMHHPGRAAVVRCSVCGEPVCLACAVPVRGRAIGPECLAIELGDPALVVPPEPAPSRTGSFAALVGALLSVAATIGPWTRTGAGDRLLGAWVPSVRWSTVAAAAAVVLLAAAWWFRASGTRAWATLVVIVGGVVAAASALAIVLPPTFQAASWGPWLGVVGGAIAVAGTILGVVREPRPGQGV